MEIITPKIPFEEYPTIDEFKPFRDSIEVTLKHNKTNYNQFGTAEIIVISVIFGLVAIAVAIFIYIFIKKRRRRDNKIQETPLERPLVA